MDYEFQVGDRVRCIAEYDDKEEAVGKFGTVRDLSIGDIGVVFDECIDGHNLSGICDDGYGWYLSRECLELVDDGCDFEIDEDAWKRLMDDFTK